MLKMGKKVVSLILVVCLMCSVFSISTSATSDDTSGNQNILTGIGDDMSVKSTNSFGNLLTSELEQEADKQEENNGINIFSVEVTGKTATAEFETLQDSTLVVAIYDESGVKMLASGRTEVTKEDTTAEVTIETKTMPTYFYLKAFLVDNEVYRPLCSAYESPNYTKEMQEFFAKTTDDFASDKVLNLDDDKTNNFAVYDEGTKIIEQNSNKNQVASVDDESKKYVIENADSSITSLKSGDIFSYNYGNDEILIVKVKSVSISGTTATIYGDEVAMEEVFDYVKIDETSDLSQAEVDPSTCDEGVTYEGMNEEKVNPKSKNPVGASLEGSISTSISMKFDSLIEGGLDLKTEAKTKLYITLKYQYVELSIEYSAKFSVDIKSELPGINFKLVTIGISPVPGVTVKFTPSFVFEADVKIELSGTLSGSVGIRAEVGKGIENISKSPSFKTELKVKGTVFVGLAMEPRLDVLGGLASVGLEAKFGAELEASMSLYNSESYKQEDVIHNCDQCIKGEIFAKFSLSADVCFLKMESLKLKRTFLEGKFKIFDFYYSFNHNEFGFTTCPYIMYKTTVTVKDKSGNPVSVATVNDEYTTDADGKAEFFLNGGEYTISAKKGELSGKKSILVDEKPVSVTVTVAKDLTDNYNAEAASFSLGGFHSAYITENGDLYMWGWNDVGQLGDGTTNDRHTPQKIMSNVKSVSLGYNYSGAITENGDLYMWGNNVGIVLGDETTTDRHTPTKIMSNVKSVSLGTGHSAAITENGDLYMWGNNWDGQLGDGTTTDRFTPTKIMSNVKSVSLGAGHSAAITENGDLYMWGGNWDGTLGDGTTDRRHTPTKIMSDVKSISLGDSHSGAITQNGDLYMWGGNWDGQLGDGTDTNRFTPTKIMSNVKAVSLGGWHSAAITQNGDLYMWGWNDDGQLGDGTRTDRHTPTKIMSNVKAVSLGDSHSGAITENGDLYTWGENYHGQLGNGTTTYRYIPTKITILSAKTKSVAPVSAGSDYKTEEFTDLLPNEVYNFYSMKTQEAENPFGSVNLLYITQATTDENGKLSITYKPDENYDKAVNFVVPLKQTDLSTADVTMDNLDYNGENQYVTPVVTLNGKILIEGKDYDLSGDYFAKDAGSYTVTINGRGLYTGEVDFTYSVLSSQSIGDVNSDGIVDINDATLIQKHLVKLVILSSEQLAVADTDGDGVISVKDATQIQKYLVGIVPSLG